MGMEDEDEWEWEIATARARAVSDDSALEEHVEEVEDWEAIIAAARVRASNDDASPALASGSNENLPIARESHDVIAQPPPPASDPSVPRTVIPVPALPTADPQRVRDYVASMRSQPARGKTLPRRAR